MVKGESLRVVTWPWASHYSSLNSNFFSCNIWFKKPHYPLAVVQWNEIIQYLAYFRCSDHGGYEIIKADVGEEAWGLWKQQILLGKGFEVSFNTFTVVFSSNLKALVCPFSRYSLSTLGMQSRELPCKTQECCYILDAPFLFLPVPNLGHWALTGLENRILSDLPHIMGSFLAFWSSSEGQVCFVRDHWRELLDVMDDEEQVLPLAWWSLLYQPV